MTRILLMRPNSDVYCTPVPLGLMYLSSYLKKKHWCDIKLLDGRAKNLKGREKYVEAIQAFNPDIVGISAMHHEAQASKQLAGLIKNTKKNCVVVIGGAYPSSDYESCLKCKDIDFAVINEGEEAFLELIKYIEEQKPVENVKGVAYRKDGVTIFNGNRAPIEDLDAIPYPDYSLVDMNLYFYGTRPGITNPIYWKKKAVNIMTSRGCPFKCTYCHKIFGKHIRYRSIDNVMGEISFLHRKYKIEEVEFLDDCFNLNLKRAKKLLDALIESKMNLKISFPNGLRVDCIDKELVDKLKGANTYKVSFGIETASPRLQSKIRKNINLEKAKRTITIVAESGIHTTGFFMLGLPSETEQEMKMTINYALNSSLHSVSFLILTPFPGTEIWEHACSNNGVYTHYDKISVNLSHVSDERLYQLRKMAYRKFYFNPRRILALFGLLKGKRNITYNMKRMALLSLRGKRG